MDYCFVADQEPIGMSVVRVSARRESSSALAIYGKSEVQIVIANSGSQADLIII